MHLLLEAILDAWGPGGELAAPWCLICSRETSVRVGVSQTCRPSGQVQGLPLASKDLQSHLWMDGSILRQG